MPPLVHHRTYSEGPRVSGAGFQETVQTAGAYREVGHMARGDHDRDGQGMLRGDDTVLKIPVAEKERVPIGVIAPGGGRIAGEAVMVAAEDAVGATVAGGSPMGTGPRRQYGPVAAEDQGLEIAQEAALDRGEDATGAEEVCQAREQLLGQAFSHGVGLRGIAGLRGVPVRLFLLEVAPMAPLAEAAQADAVSAWRRLGAVCEPVNKRRERAHRRRLEGGQASDLCEARMGAQVVSPLGETLIVEE